MQYLGWSKALVVGISLVSSLGLNLHFDAYLIEWVVGRGYRRTVRSNVPQTR